MQGRSGTLRLKLHNLCVGRSTLSRKDHWVHIPDPGTYSLVVNPIVDGAFLPKTLFDGGSSLNIIFTETLRKMDFNFNKMTACNKPFYGSCPARLL
jgi:hypothetical protein